MKVQTKAESIGKSGCLFFCYLYCSGMWTDDGDALKMAVQAMDKGLIDKNCTVLDADALLYQLTGRRYSVTKKKIDSIALISRPTPVKFSTGGDFGHWVVVENGKIVFNPLDYSNQVTNGKPVDSRVIYAV